MYPLIVCIAGYRNYDTKYITKTIDGARYIGIFGINEREMAECVVRGRGDPMDFGTIFRWNLLNPYLPLDLRCLLNLVLNRPKELRRYQQLCKPPLVRNVTCQVNRFSTVTVYDPIYKDLYQTNLKAGRDPLPAILAESKSGRKSSSSKPDSCISFYSFVALSLYHSVSLLNCS
ncbi:hypothetical protein GE061_012976 [Apolygus lucorum]|uniref:Uncharacterized protein n=1 Tax=Apolygus lucorum TaxID=248454 RepID=A0A6A4JCT0_APOLU|nr:hypothetical protein GE061_012976 [Apolygus lucorum]